MNLFRRLFSPPPTPQQWAEPHESRLHRLESENRDIKARLAILEQEHRLLLAPPETGNAPAE
jgi:hypothetical protein